MKENLLNTLYKYKKWDKKSEVACVYLMVIFTQSKPSLYVTSTYNLLLDHEHNTGKHIDGYNPNKVSILMNMGFSYDYYILRELKTWQRDERDTINWTNHFLDKLYDPYKSNTSKMKAQAPSIYNILNNTHKIEVEEMTGGSLNSKKNVRQRVNEKDIRHFEETVVKYMKVSPPKDFLIDLTEEEEAILEQMSYALLHYDYPVECEKCVILNPLNPKERRLEDCYDCVPRTKYIHKNPKTNQEVATYEAIDIYEERVRKLQLQADLDIKLLVAKKINLTFEKLQRKLDNIDYKIALQENTGIARSALTNMNMTKLI